MRWLVPGNVVTEIQAADPAMFDVLNTSASWVIGDPAPTERWVLLLGATPIARYRSFARFQTDLTNRRIDPAYRWVLYDPESWPDTPQAEELDPWTAMQEFGQCAHAHGYRVIMAPARDLGNVADAGHPKNPGEDLGDWQIRTKIPMWAAEYADVIDVQAQSQTLDLAAYASFVSRASRQARNANRFCKVLAGVSTHYGTAQEMAAAARSVQVAGFWLNVPGPSPDVAKACEFLRLITGGA